MDFENIVSNSIIIPEIYFLISKFLSNGPLEETAKVLIKELEEKKVLPKRIDWLGGEHDQTFSELERKYPHIGATHLLEICSRICPILDKEIPPSVNGIASLLGSGSQNLLRTKESICRSRSLLDYCTRLHGMPLPDSISCKPTHNLFKVLIGRETGGSIRRKHIIPTNFYSKTKLLRRTLGHLSAVYCVLFDRSGRHIITGADDLLVKLWSAVDGRLLATFRGASAEITDIAINLDNTLLAAGSLDRILRVWDLQTTAPIAVLTGHTGMITSVNFCPSPRGDLKYLVTTSTDGSVAFWQYTTPRGAKTIFAPKPIQYHEKLRPGQAQMICASFSPGGIFLAAGSADHHVRVYIMQEEGPKRILEIEAHTDAVDSIQWAHQGLRFVSGSKDGTAHVWTFESQQWKSLKLNMNERLLTCPEPEEGKKIKVTMVSWDFSDQWVITAVNDFSIKIWNAKTGKLHKVLRGHKDELYVLESHPVDENVLLSAGHDGQLFIWDIDAGVSVAHFVNNIDGQGHGGVFDAKWSPDGSMIAGTDSHGHILMLGFGDGHARFKSIPKELFFHTDYRPLLRDSNHHVMDEQTQLMPHLMPPPFLVDIDGNPYPPFYQKLVPGRENCSSEQLVPNISISPEGVEVVDGSSYSHLDILIEALANRQRQDAIPDSNNDRNNQNPLFNMNNGHRLNGSPRASGSAPGNSPRIGPRRTGDVEGVRQSSGNWQRETFKYMRRVYVRPMNYATLQNIRQTVHAAGQVELDIYRREMRKRPIMINTSSSSTPLQILTGRMARRGPGRGRNNERRPPASYRTRAVREQEQNESPARMDDDDEEESSSSSSDSSLNINEEMLNESSSSETESSDYSDWVADKPGPNLEPPKRARRKRAQQNSESSSDDNHQQPGPSTSAASGRAGRSNDSPKPRKKQKIQIPPNGEIPEAFKPPEWLSEVVPRKAPYYPQMGDEIVYFRQGHAKYLDAVRQKKLYNLTRSSEPWSSIHLRDHELVRVIGIKYEIRPPRLCCLKLALINTSGEMTGQTFTIKYHDMPDVLDFLVLRQTYETAVRRNWSPGDRFRCMIEDCWWVGQIESRHPISSEFPDSRFMCYRVRWDNGEYEYMSPWDMEPIDEDRLPDEMGGAVQVLPEELRATLYQPKPEEWPRGDREASCRRIIAGLEQVMVLAIADAFLAPVDLSIYPSYAFAVEYPIDLTTIKARFENHFYRRITSAQFDVRYLATNAEKFNKSHSKIVKNARIITDLCLRIISATTEVDVNAIYHQLVATYISSESEDENEAGPSTSTARASTSQANGSRRSKRLRLGIDWKTQCRELLEMLWQCDDSTPFREPVDTLDHPDYLQIIDTPMDLRTIKEDLIGENYATPMEFAKDIRLIFTNSRNYNTNKRSRIYTMTLRLSTLFETHLKDIILNWKASCRRKESSKSPKKKSDRNKPGPSTRKITSNGNSRRKHNISDDDDDDDDDEHHHHGINHDDDDDDSDRNRRRPRRGNKNIRNGVTSGSSSHSNGVSSTMHHEPQSVPSNSRNLRRVTSRPNSQEDDTRGSQDSNSTDDSSSDDYTDESRGIPVSELGISARAKRIAAQKRAIACDDSEESYNPKYQYKKKKSMKKRKRKSEKHDESPRKRGRNAREPPKKSRRIASHTSDENEEDDDDDYELQRNSKTKRNKFEKKTRGRRRGRKKLASSENEGSSSRGQQRPTNNYNSTTPKKRGRPIKNRQAPSLHGGSEDNSGDDLNSSPSPDMPTTSRGTRGRERASRAESDHSYHIGARNSKRAIVESDTEEQISRPTRLSARKALLEWARGSNDDDDDDENDGQDEPEIFEPPSSRSQGQRTNRQPSKGRSRKKTSESDQSLEDPLATTASGRRNMLQHASQRQNSTTEIVPLRTVRTNRNSRVVAETSESNSSSDNEPLASSQQALRSRRNLGNISNVNNDIRINNNSTLSRQSNPSVTNRRNTTLISTSSTSYHHATRSTSNLDAVSSSSITAIAASSSTTSQRNSHSHIHNDHNYGEPGSSTLRINTRRMLSRHQRNADELDSLAGEDTDPLDMASFGAAPSNTINNPRRRMRNGGVNSTTPTLSNDAGAQTSSISTMTSSRPLRQSRTQPRYRDDEEDDVNDRSNPITNNNTTSLSSTRRHHNQEEQTDSEDNQPLTFVAANSTTRRVGLRGTLNNVTNGVSSSVNGSIGTVTAAITSSSNNHLNTGSSTVMCSTQAKRRPRRYISDEESDDIDVGNIDDNDPLVNLRRNAQNQLLGLRQRNSAKRPHYNENSDDSNDNNSPMKKGTTTSTIVNNITNPTSTATISSQPTQSNPGYNRSQRVAAASSSSNSNHIDPNSIDDDDTENEEQTVSISSRGRVRKITAKARGLFKD